MLTHTIKLIPDNQEFITTSKQDILESALSAGINLQHGCSSGNCGKCVARLVKGEIAQIRYSDYPLSNLQKETGEFLTCCHAALTDIELEVKAVSSVSQVLEQHIEARVYRLEQLGDDVVSVTLKTPRSQHLQFLAGQYVTVDLGQGVQRNKSLASCPCDSLKPILHVRRHDNDPFSEHVFQHLKKNDRVNIDGPWGDFTLVEDSAWPLLLIAYDTGFASIKSLLEHFIALDTEQPVHLYWLSPPNSEPYMDNYCRSLSDALDNFTFSKLKVPSERLDDLIRTLNRVLEQTERVAPHNIFATLPHEHFASVQQWFIDQKVDESRLHLDRIGWFGANSRED